MESEYTVLTITQVRPASTFALLRTRLVRQEGMRPRHPVAHMRSFANGSTDHPQQSFP